MNKAFAALVCFSVCLYCSFTLAAAPVKLIVSPGQQQPVTLSRLHLNRIVTPFSAPQIRTIDQADIRIERLSDLSLFPARRALCRLYHTS